MPEIIPNLHPFAVHFPIALVSLSAFVHVAALVMQNRPQFAAPCAVIAHSTLWLSALAVLIAVIYGLQAFNSVHHDDVSHAAMLVHRSWALSTLAVLAVLAISDAWRSKVTSMPVWWFTWALIGAWAMVAVTAWHGGELVYRHGLGVMSLPAAETGRHGHAHGLSESPVPAHEDIMPQSAEVHEHAHADHEHQ